MNNNLNTNVIEKTTDFSKLVLTDFDFENHNFKNDFVLSVRLSYGIEKQNDQIFLDYVNFLKNDLKIINEKNEITIENEKISSYFYIFKKTENFKKFFSDLKSYLENNKNDKLSSLYNCYVDINNVNFTIANFKEKKDKIKNFISFCKNQKLIIA